MIVYSHLDCFQQSGFPVIAASHNKGNTLRDRQPSSLHVEIPHTLAKFPAAYYARDCSRIALQDSLATNATSFSSTGWAGLPIWKNI